MGRRRRRARRREPARPSVAALGEVFQQSTNTTIVLNKIDRGFVMAPNGKMLSIDAETLALGPSSRPTRPQQQLVVASVLGR
jgi:hypothetical protein